MLTLLTALIGAVPLVADSPHVASPPAIQITLNGGGNYYPGGLVNVRVTTNDDGYLIVFRVDGDGRIRVLFPLDPDGDAFVRGGKDYELRGRGDRSTFLADDQGGSGMVYAAVAHQSYNVRDFTANGHWDYDALRLRDSSVDAEADLTAIVGRMLNRARFDYDAVGYRVQDIAPIAGGGVAPGVGAGYYSGLYDPYYNPRWRCLSCGWGYPGADFVDGFGYSPFWDPYLYSPWAYNYGYGFGFGFTGTTLWYGNGNPFHGNHPIPVPPGTRARPRAIPTPGTTNVNAPPPRGRPVPNAPPPPPVHSNAPPTAGPGTRARPRPNDLAVTTTQAPTPAGRPVFRQPPQTYQPAPRQDPTQSRPVYREPPSVYRAPPQSAPSQGSAPRAAPPPQSSAPRSAPPPASSGGGSRPRGGGRP